MLHRTVSASDIKTVTYSVILESVDTSAYNYVYRKTLNYQLFKSIDYLNSYEIVESPEIMEYFSNILQSPLNQVDIDSFETTALAFQTVTNVDGILVLYIQRLFDIPSPHKDEYRRVFNLSCFLFDGIKKTVVWNKRRVAIGDEWSILFHDLEMLFADRIHSDYPINIERKPYKVTQRKIDPCNKSIDSGATCSKSSYPGSFDEMFSKASSFYLERFEGYSKYYNDSISYNVYSVDENNNKKINSKNQRSFYMLNYYTSEKPDSFYNKRNFVKCVWLLDAICGNTNFKNAISRASLGKTELLMGITDYGYNDTLFPPVKRPLHVFFRKFEPNHEFISSLDKRVLFRGETFLPQFYGNIKHDSEVFDRQNPIWYLKITGLFLFGILMVWISGGAKDLLKLLNWIKKIISNSRKKTNDKIKSNDSEGGSEFDGSSEELDAKKMDDSNNDEKVVSQTSMVNFLSKTIRKTDPSNEMILGQLNRSSIKEEQIIRKLVEGDNQNPPYEFSPFPEIHPEKNRDEFYKRLEFPKERFAVVWYRKKHEMHFWDLNQLKEDKLFSLKNDLKKFRFVLDPCKCAIIKGKYKDNTLGIPKFEYSKRYGILSDILMYYTNELKKGIIISEIEPQVYYDLFNKHIKITKENYPNCFGVVKDLFRDRLKKFYLKMNENEEKYNIIVDSGANNGFKWDVSSMNIFIIDNECEN
jgi:hypothetical protein